MGKDRIKPFSEDISTGSSEPGSFREIELTKGSPDWNQLLGDIKQWKKSGGTLHAKLKGKKEFGKLSTQQGKLSTQQVTYPEDIQNEEDYFNMLRRDYRTADPERKIFLLFVIQTEANMQREKGRALTDMDEEIAANKASDDLLDLSPEEKEEWIQHVYGQPPGWTPYAEVKLNLGSKEWQDMRKEIARWKKSGGTLHAKMTGKPDPKEKKEVEELIAERGPNLTEEDKDLIAWTPGIIPPWFNKNPSKDSYDYHAIQAIKDLGVSAMEVHYAVERAYTGDPPLTAKDKDILRVGWGQVFAEKNVVPHGEFYHKDKGWYS